MTDISREELRTIISNMVDDAQYDDGKGMGQVADEILSLVGKRVAGVAEGWIVVHEPTRSLIRPRNRDEIIAALRKLFGVTND